ncbi:MAG: ABC transporter ATP-binding protein [Candidatus Rokuibacteriota bacterium]
MTTLVVEAGDLHKTRGTQRALAGVSLSAASGEVLSIVGPNGAGKSTLIEILQGLFRPDRGQVTVLGEDPARFRSATRARVGTFLQQPGLPARLTVSEVLALFALCYRSLRPLNSLLERFRLADIRHVQVRYLSQGQRLRVSLALAFVRRFDVMFLDEPMAHIDPEGRAALWEEIRAAREAGAAVVCSTHMIDELPTRSDHVVVLRGGRAVASASPRELLTPYAGLTKLELRGIDPHVGGALGTIPGVVRVRCHRGDIVLHCRDAGQVLAWLAPHAPALSLAAGPITLEDVVRVLTDEHR